ncbi:MAG: hypothetical protein A2254_14725 [Ignavibacteria bacterium RIFOXYA2_FULL_35_9]|nr:MAG: hypothetical protein A2254_14725 [Ignavibacteria bacterium RIFOXYA2_FULL_35_9]
MLADYFLRKFSLEQEKEIKGFHEEVLDFMKQRRWAGNIRELENFVERLVTLTTKKQKIIDRKTLPPELQKELKKSKKDSSNIPTTKSLSESLTDYEEELIRTTLKNCNWNQSKAARALNISEHDMRYKMKKLRIEKPKA